MQKSYKKAEIQKFCQNEVLENSTLFEKMVIKECFGYIVQRISEIWILFPHMTYDYNMRFEFSISNLESQFSMSSTLESLLTLS